MFTAGLFTAPFNPAIGGSLITSGLSMAVGGSFEGHNEHLDNQAQQKAIESQRRIEKARRDREMAEIFGHPDR